MLAQKILPFLTPYGVTPAFPATWDVETAVLWINSQIEDLMLKLEETTAGDSSIQRLEYLRQVDQLQQVARTFVEEPSLNGAAQRVPKQLALPLTGTNTTWTYLMDALCLQECRETLFQTDEEWIVMLTGPRQGKTVVLDRLMIVEDYDTQSAGRATATGNAVYETLISLDEAGMALNGVFHNHLIKGIQRPSAIDTDFADRLFRGGYTAVQCIFSLDGYLSFFADHPFAVEISGKGVDRVDERTFRLT